jgi:YspA, cpYpsA-related SLOG family
VKVLVCGGRDFSNVAFVWTTLERIHGETPITAIMQGGADGADYLANEWAKTKPGVQRYVCKADWKKHAKAAGPIRNARMLEWKPDLVVAFPGGRGTADMVRRSREAGFDVREF